MRVLVRRIVVFRPVPHTSTRSLNAPTRRTVKSAETDEKNFFKAGEPVALGPVVVRIAGPLRGRADGQSSPDRQFCMRPPGIDRIRSSGVHNSKWAAAFPFYHQIGRISGRNPAWMRIALVQIGFRSEIFRWEFNSERISNVSCTSIEQ